jgi:hypothetical protein
MMGSGAELHNCTEALSLSASWQRHCICDRRYKVVQVLQPWHAQCTNLFLGVLVSKSLLYMQSSTRPPRSSLLPILTSRDFLVV